MGVKLQCCFDIDLPTAMQTMLDNSTKKAEDGTYKFFTSARALCKEHPGLIPYMVKNGYLSGNCDLLLIVTPDYAEKLVDQPVAQ